MNLTYSRSLKFEECNPSNKNRETDMLSFILFTISRKVRVFTRKDGNRADPNQKFSDP